METADYRYSPLAKPREQLRLLTLLPSNHRDDELVGRLSTHRLPSPGVRPLSQLRELFSLPKYISISYVWGVGPELRITRSIKIDGLLLGLTETVFRALQTLRHYFQVSIKVWVDVICINQLDMEEKSCQIPLMPIIYTLATLGFVWLSDVSSEASQLLTTIENLTNDRLSALGNKLRPKLFMRYNSRKTLANGRSTINWSRFGIEEAAWKLFIKAAWQAAGIMVRGLPVFIDGVLYWYELDGFGDMPDEIREDPSLESADVRTWEPSVRQQKALRNMSLKEIADGIEKLLSGTRYFNRMWTMQEACLGLSAFVHCGDIVVSLDQVLKAAYFVNRKLGSNQKTIDKILRLYGIKSQYLLGYRMSLLDLLYQSEDRDCWDPRDKIYALQGLMSDSMDDLLRPDYQKSVEEVYTNVARHIITSSKSLDILCSPHHQAKRLANLPSWVPDFRFFGQDEDYQPLLPRAGQRSIFNASNDTLPEFPVDTSEIANNHILEIAGAVLGVVSSTSDRSAKFDNLESAEARWNVLYQSHCLTSAPDGVEALMQLLDATSEFMRILDVFWSTQVKSAFWDCDSGYQGKLRSFAANLHNQTPECIELFKDYFLNLFCGCYFSGSDSPHNERFVNPEELISRACINDVDGNLALVKLYQAFHGGLRGRVLVRICGEAGVHYGAGLDAAIEGDIVCILYGASAPVILRQSSTQDEYTVIGECHVSGVMDGAALQSGTLATMKRFFKIV